MNFFEIQEKARRNTTWLIFLFFCAVVILIALTELLLLFVYAFSETGELIFSYDQLSLYFSWEVFLAVAAGILLLIFFGSLSKSYSLSAGGPAVAEMLGGQLVPHDTTNGEERRLLNIVEEMAIAAGMPIPQVYLLDDSAINAFAAGKTPGNAVIGITRGALSVFSRDELQGVIAHEFSHILNGDMRLNIRLISILHGIMLIGILGTFLIRSLRFSGRSRNSKNGGGLVAALFIAGLSLTIIGYAGTFFGKWIKASISRQREYLADSSAVQFTRNKDSIAGALKKIGGATAGSFISSPSAIEYSHAYFANGVSSFWQSWFATHPPLEQRIKKIDPQWDGNFPIVIPNAERANTDKTQTSEQPASPPQSTVEKIIVATAILTAAEQAISQVGTLNEENIEYVQQLLAEIPESLKTAAQTAYSARAVIYAILITHQKTKDDAWAMLDQNADKSMAVLTREYFTDALDLEERFKLPLLELCVNALRELSTNQYIQFEQSVNKMIEMDKVVDLNEWVIQRLVLQQLDEHFNFRKPPRAKYSNLGDVKNSAETLLSLIAYVEHQDDKCATDAFNLGKKKAGATAFKIIPRKALSLQILNESLDQLMQLKPLVKPRILKACAEIILADGKTTTRGIELIRTISTCLDCPMPPMKAQD